jgi:hypothetical protein
MDDPSQDQIRARAYQLWEGAGRPEDRAQEFWLEAERELTGATGGTAKPNDPDETSETFLE